MREDYCCVVCLPCDLYFKQHKHAVPNTNTPVHGTRIQLPIWWFYTATAQNHLLFPFALKLTRTHVKMFHRCTQASGVI